MLMFRERALKYKNREGKGDSLNFARYRQNLRCWKCSKKDHSKTNCHEREDDQEEEEETEEKIKQTQFMQAANLEARNVNTNAWFDGNFDH